MYLEILKAWRQEREENTLCSLSSDFFLRAQVCFTQIEKKEEYRPFNEKITYRIKYLLEDLIKIRSKKILSLLTQSPPQTVPLQALTRTEREFVKSFNILFQNLFENQLKDLNTSLDTVSKDENQATTLPFDSSKDEKEGELALIRVIRPIPAFLGTDGLVYGPLAVGDIVNIPRELAYRILIPKGAAVEIETE
ncbi:MAG: hypothetical protein ACFFCZ_14465 [Promethearchaeota archaeon]